MSASNGSKSVAARQTPHRTPRQLVDEYFAALTAAGVRAEADIRNEKINY